MIQRASLAALLAAMAAFGLVVDFLTYGVAEVVWVVVYLPVYLVAASVPLTYLGRLRPGRDVWACAGAIAFGVLAGRLLLVGRHDLETYSMAAEDDGVVTLRSPDWPKYLVVSSAKLSAGLAAAPATAAVPVVVDVVTDYGCIRSFLVSSVAGVDVKDDPRASWTWKTNTAIPAGVAAGPGLEDQRLPWCRFRFYRR